MSAAISGRAQATSSQITCSMALEIPSAAMVSPFKRGSRCHPNSAFDSEGSHLLVPENSDDGKIHRAGFRIFRDGRVPYVFGFVIRASTSVPSARLSRNVRVSPGFNFING